MDLCIQKVSQIKITHIYKFSRLSCTHNHMVGKPLKINGNISVSVTKSNGKRNSKF